MVKLSFLLLLICLSACGKKSTSSNDALDVGSSFQPAESVESELNYKTIKEAVKNNNHGLVRQLVEKNTDVNLNQLNEDGETLLMLAIRNDFKEIRNIFIEINFGIN